MALCLKNLRGDKQLYNKIFIFFLLLFLYSESATGSLITDEKAVKVTYNLSVDYKTVHFKGKKRKAMVINNSLPAPTLYFKEGQKAVIFVTNKMDVETSIHWHGILLPNYEDGVPYLTSPPIRPGKTHKFEFQLKQSGTYWYHSHTNLQEQRGLYGAIVIEPKEKIYDQDLVLVLSDWTNENPYEVLRTLKRGSEWYAIKKQTALSLLNLIKEGGLKAQLKMWKQKMPGMDISDVYYDAFLINGKTTQSYPNFKAGEKIRLRVINSAASTYFWLSFGGAKPLLVSADGMDIKPIFTNKVLHAVAETYDFILKLPQKKSIEIRAVAQDGSGSASAVIGKGELLKAPLIPKPDPIEEVKKMADSHGGHHKHGSSKNYHSSNNGKSRHHKDHSSHAKDHSNHKDHSSHAKDHSNHKDHSSHAKDHSNHKDHSSHAKDHSNHKDHSSHAKDHSNHKDHSSHAKDHSNHKDHSSHASENSKNKALHYNHIRAIEKTSFPKTNRIKELHFNLTGNMWRYAWSINNKTLSQSDTIKIKKGETVRIHLHNKTMMHHPMHLHGHFFRVLNQQKEYSPLKHTVDIPPMETVVIEFDPDEEGDWMFHCHILYHMKSGMSRIFNHNHKRDPRLKAYPISKILKGDNHWYKWGEVDLMSHRLNWSFVSSNIKNKLIWDGVFSWFDHNYNYYEQMETNLSYEYFISDFFRVYIGLNADTSKRKEKPYKTNSSILKNLKPEFGFRYLLPYFLELEMNIDHLTQLQVGLEYEILILPRLELLTEWEWTANLNTAFMEHEWSVGLNYILNKDFSLAADYSNHFSWGAGLNWKF